MVLHEFDSLLTHDADTIPYDLSNVWVSDDLDGDGQIELVTQSFDRMDIYSAPDWRNRGSFTWLGHVVSMHAASVNVDNDQYVEVFATPNTLGGHSFVVIIKYDPVLDTFKIASQIEVSPSDGIPPDGALGQPAIGDFDEDGRVEFIVGDNHNGYEQFEWQDTGLAYVGFVGDSTPGAAIFSATACRPLPDGKLYALLGSSQSNGGGIWRYQLVKSVGDNLFQVVHVFADTTGFIGFHPCWAADTDCDGLDELYMTVYPDYRVWEWEEGSNSFVRGCSWNNSSYGSLAVWQDADLDLDGSSEWIAVNSTLQLYVFDDPDCVNCDTLGQCPPDPGCPCFCHGDPECNGIVDVFDVVDAVDVAFRDGSPLPDPHENCPHERTDVDCSNLTDVFDVVAFVDVAFRSGNAESLFCDPCD